MNTDKRAFQITAGACLCAAAMFSLLCNLTNYYSVIYIMLALGIAAAFVLLAIPLFMGRCEHTLLFVGAIVLTASYALDALVYLIQSARLIFRGYGLGGYLIMNMLQNILLIGGAVMLLLLILFRRHGSDLPGKIWFIPVIVFGVYALIVLIREARWMFSSASLMFSVLQVLSLTAGVVFFVLPAGGGSSYNSPAGGFAGYPGYQQPRSDPGYRQPRQGGYPGYPQQGQQGGYPGYPQQGQQGSYPGYPQQGQQGSCPGYPQQGQQGGYPNYRQPNGR